MSEKLQQAISSIKVGNKQLGQQLLAQIIQTEPNNETAWLWMSAVVDEDKRQYCIERVLKINPGNQQAIQALEKLKTKGTNHRSSIETTAQKQTITETSASLSSSSPLQSIQTKPEPEPEIPSARPASEKPKAKLWVNQMQKTSHILILLDDKMIVAKCDPRLTAQVQLKIMEGNLASELMTEMAVVSYTNLLVMEERIRTLKISFKNKRNEKETTRFECKDDEMAQAIMESFEARLIPNFKRSVTQMSRGSLLLGNGIVLTIVMGIIAFLYFAANDIQTNSTSPVGSSRTRLMIILLGWIGPGGIACIGGGILLILIFSMIMSLLKPPLVTTLSKKPGNAMKKLE